MKDSYFLRPADIRDSPAIHSLIREAGINPLGLNWQRFIVAVDSNNQVIGCGQIKVHADGSRELASITVQPAWRQQGIATAIIERLLNENRGVIYLTCRQHMGLFYERFGFHVVEHRNTPRYFRRIAAIFNLMKRLGVMNEGLLVMQRSG